MKLRWWIVGIAAAVAGGIIALKHLVDNQNKTLRFVDNERKNRFNEYHYDVFKSEFDGEDYLT
jgi:hypothetical protein